MAYLVNKSFEPEMKVITFNEQWVTMATEDDRHDTTFTATLTPHGNVAAEAPGCLSGWLVSPAPSSLLLGWGCYECVCKTFKLKLDLAVTEFKQVDANHL